MDKAEPKILSLKLKKKGVEVVYLDRYVDSGGSVIENETSSLLRVEPHIDLVSHIHRLSAHYADLLEEEPVVAEDLNKPDEVARMSQSYPVRGIIFKNTDKFSGVMLSGYKKLSTGHAVNMLTRLVKFNEPSEQYELSDELQEVVDDVRKEGILLLGGKHAKPAQTTITDPDQVAVED